MNFTQRGFTIVELLIVIIIIGVLAAAGVGKYASFATQARQRTCLGNQKQITQAMQVWQTKKVQVPKQAGAFAGGGYHAYFNGQTGASIGMSAPGQVTVEWNANLNAVRDILDDTNVFRCPENTARRPEPRGQAAQGANGGAGATNIYYWFRDWYNGGWSPSNVDTSHTTCYSWGYNNGVWPDGTQATQHMQQGTPD